MAELQQISRRRSGRSYHPDRQWLETPTYTVVDDVNYVQPYPEYEIKWQTPSAVSVYFKVELADNNALPGNIATLVQNAIISAFNGEDGGTRARIGSTIYAGRYYAGVQAIDSDNVDIFSITISRDGLHIKHLRHLALMKCQHWTHQTSR
jgi:hypothetical protein